MSKAQDQLRQISDGIDVLLKYNKEIALAGNHKAILCSGPRTLEEGDLDDMASLGWEWSDEQEAWSFYTGQL